jgi:hypothetical protein
MARARFAARPAAPALHASKIVTAPVQPADTPRIFT